MTTTVTDKEFKAWELRLTEINAQLSTLHVEKALIEQVLAARPAFEKLRAESRNDKATDTGDQDKGRVG